MGVGGRGRGVHWKFFSNTQHAFIANENNNNNNNATYSIQLIITGGLHVLVNATIFLAPAPRGIKQIGMNY